MGFLGFGDSAPDPTTVQLDPGTAQLENQQAQMAAQPSSYYSGILNQNIGNASQLGQTGAQAGQSAARLGMQPGQFQAIRNVYNGQAQQGIQRLKAQNDMQGEFMKSDYMNQLSKAMLGQQQQAVNQGQFLTNAYMQQEASRAQTINSLFQVGDQVIGMNARMKGPNTTMPISTQDNSVAGGNVYGGFAMANPAGDY